MTESPNGLASLTQARERRVRRTMPPPRHPIAADPTPAPTPQEAQRPPEPTVGEEPTVDSEDLEETLPPAPTPRRPAATGSRPRGRRSASEPLVTQPAPTVAADPIKPVTVYVSEEQSDFLEEVRIAGLMERVDISRSAVVRLALSRLQRQMNVQDIKQHLMAQPTDPNRTGRKRR